uniref:Uncharacterized protein n=1 Tax=Acrobeloides nanus TaxID=290746 RepID=A0A914EB82_9BILA
MYFESVLDAVKTLLNNTQLRVKYSLETKEFHNHYDTYQCLNRRCVLHETDSYALVIEIAYRNVTDMSSINASDLDQPPCEYGSTTIEAISFCVKLL